MRKALSGLRPGKLGRSVLRPYIAVATSAVEFSS